MKPGNKVLLSMLCVVCALGPGAALQAVEHVLANVRGRQLELTGKVLMEDSAGSVLLESDEGGLWPIPAPDLKKRTSDSTPFERLDKEQLGERLLAEMGPGFQIHESKHYVVCYNTTRTYAKWCSSLLERLQRAFISYWKKKGCDVHEPEEPLVVLVFSDRQSYERYAKAELGAGLGNAIGYYSILTNRIAMYDLTGMQQLRKQSSRRGSMHDISRLLSQRAAVPLVATVVHEATHQISYNCGLQKRLADNPAWLSEGLAVFFETPDLSSNRSWTGIGKVNYSRWDLFRQNVNNGKAGDLRSLIANDERIAGSRTAVDAYAEAWAWTYFLIKWHPEEYVAYLKTLGNKPQLSMDEPQTRLADFQKHFGNDFEALRDEFIRRMSRID